jgi:hypothetical protein
MSLADWIGARAGAGWSAEKFRLGTEEALSRGKFPLVIVSAQPDQSVQEALAYLRGMNLEVHVLGFEHQTDRGDELARPMAVELEVATATPAAPSQPEPVRPEPAARLGQAVTQRIELDEHVRTATIGTPGQPVKPFGVKTREYAPFPASNATPKQQEVLERLLPLDELGMERRGFEYFVPKAAGKAAVEGTIVVAIDPERWPFPTEDEVIVVVNTGQEFLAAFLKIPPAEAEEFLASLPRVERKEHKGSLLLRAANTHEATQLVNELRALREVSAGG